MTNFDSVKDGEVFIFKGTLYIKVMEESIFYNAVEFKDSDKAIAFAGGEEVELIGSIENAIEYCEIWG